MISNIDIKKLQSLPVEQVAEAVGMKVRKHKTLCPWHADTIPSLTFNRARNRYRCYVCDAHGGVLDLVMNRMNLNFRDACHWLAQTFSIHISDEHSRQFHNIVPRKVQPARKEPVTLPVDTHHLSKLVCQPHLSEDAKHFLFEERKISSAVVRWLGISSIECPVPMSGNPHDAWFNAPSLLIPYKDMDGNVLSVQARYLGNSTMGSGREGAPRFQFPRGSQCHIFNLPILRTLKPGDCLWITEGVSDCMAMMSAKRKAIAVPSATLLKAEDVAGILPYLEGVKICCSPDEDTPGQTLFLKLRAFFPAIIYQPIPVGYKDFGEYWASVNCKI